MLLTVSSTIVDTGPGVQAVYKWMYTMFHINIIKIRAN